MQSDLRAKRWNDAKRFEVLGDSVQPYLKNYLVNWDSYFCRKLLCRDIDRDVELVAGNKNSWSQIIQPADTRREKISLCTR